MTNYVKMFIEMFGPHSYTRADRQIGAGVLRAKARLQAHRGIQEKRLENAVPPKQSRQQFRATARATEKAHRLTAVQKAILNRGGHFPTYPKTTWINAV